MTMKKSMFHVDFNEMLEPDLVLLSAEDTKVDSHGKSVALYEGLHVIVYAKDTDSNGNADNLLAAGVVERNRSTVVWAAPAKWCCRIDGVGIHHESEL
jgi:hypothetical protein